MAASGALETLSRPRVHAIAASSSSARSSTSIRGGHVASISLRLSQFTGIRVSQRIRTIRPATAGQVNLRVDRRSTVVCEFRQVSTDGMAPMTRGKAKAAVEALVDVGCASSFLSIRAFHLPQFKRGGRASSPATAGQSNPSPFRRSAVVCDFPQAAADVSDQEVQEVTNATWRPNVTQCSMPAAVEFWSKRCSPCRIMRPRFAGMAGKYNGKLKFFRINMDQSRDLDIASEHGVSKIPALLLIKNGEKKDAVIGCASEKELVSRIDKFLGM